MKNRAPFYNLFWSMVISIMLVYGSKGVRLVGVFLVVTQIGVLHMVLVEKKPWRD